MLAHLVEIHAYIIVWCIVEIVVVVKHDWLVEILMCILYYELVEMSILSRRDFIKTIYINSSRFCKVLRRRDLTNCAPYDTLAKLTTTRRFSETINIHNTYYFMSDMNTYYSTFNQNTYCETENSSIFILPFFIVFI